MKKLPPGSPEGSCMVLESRCFVDRGKFVRREAGILDRFDVVQDLGGPGSADQNGGRHAVAQDPGKRHFGEGLAAIFRDLVQLPDLLKLLFCDIALF